jgi:hypothetical protein
MILDEFDGSGRGGFYDKYSFTKVKIEPLGPRDDGFRNVISTNLSKPMCVPSAFFNAYDSLSLLAMPYPAC